MGPLCSLRLITAAQINSKSALKNGEARHQLCIYLVVSLHVKRFREGNKIWNERKGVLQVVQDLVIRRQLPVDYFCQIAVALLELSVEASDGRELSRDLLAKGIHF